MLKEVSFEVIFKREDNMLKMKPFEWRQKC